MRALTLTAVSALLLGSVSNTVAADLDYGTLRGAEADYEPAPAYVDWSGFYVGGHGGYSSAGLGFRNVFQPIVANALRSTTIEHELGASTLLSARDARVEGASYGAYLGYNFQFDDVVIGLEADYTRFGQMGATSSVIGRTRTTDSGQFVGVNLNGQSSTKIEDFGSIRVRAGYALGSFMPFVTGGLAIGRAQIADQVGVQAYGYDQATYRANQAITDGSRPAYVNNYGYSYFNQANPGASWVAAPEVYGSTKSKTVAGISLGAGLEYAVTSNILLRGEYQWVQFNDFEGHKANVNTVRGGAAIKF